MAWWNLQRKPQEKEGTRIIRDFKLKRHRVPKLGKVKVFGNL